ncbi:MAG: TIM barrel protein [Candidatus Aenigmatarchaeota archaeon]
MQILLGPAGSPAKSTMEGIVAVKKLGLQAMEVQFSHGVKMSLLLAKQVGETAKKEQIELSVHAPYFINLVSEEKRKIDESKKRILDSCERGHLFAWNRATNIVFHPAYFGKLSKEQTYQRVKEEMRDIMSVIKEKKWNVRLAPETTGKHSAFGSLDETIAIAKELKCGLCIDLAHLYARNNGKIDYAEVLDKVNALKRDHLNFHFSGINYSSKGELNHLNLSKPEFEPFARELLKRKINATIISESPITWKDSLKMKKIFEKLGYKF